MRIPQATYRLQFSSRFTFSDATRIIEYLATLGISDIYASPIFKCVKDSQHGYDVVDFNQLNPQLGEESLFNQLLDELNNKGLGWIQDIVPNHMAFHSQNRWLMDVLEKGPLSRYYQFFDIDWNHPYDHLKGKVLAPFLGDIYGSCLDQNLIKLSISENGLSVNFYDFMFPLKISSYEKVMTSNISKLEEKIARNDPDYIHFLEIPQGLKNIANLDNIEGFYNQVALMKAQLWKLYNSNSIIKEYIDNSLNSWNGVLGNPYSLKDLDDLLSDQFFRLSFWKVGNEELNYRRFFTINGLIGLSVEKQEVFEQVHNLVFRLINENKITGLRIDHVDGLYNPLTYLNQIRQRAPNTYIVIEKILDRYEQLPTFLPVQGTTGYDFMNIVNDLFVDSSNEKNFDRIYSSFTGINTSYRNLVSEKKKLYMGKHMAGDIDNLAQLLKQILNRNRYGRDFTLYALRKAIVEIMAEFPVYRAYMSEEENSNEDKIHIKEAMTLARNKNPGLVHEFYFIEKVLLLEFLADTSSIDKHEYYHFAKRFQQFSGALMAKGSEDTAFYIYNRLISLNEVGGDPSLFGLKLETFHDFMVNRQKLWPHTLNATSTHDTKRGEDVRARINVLSEMPNEWEDHLLHWSKINKDKKINISGILCPENNDEYFIYQTLIGTYPIDTPSMEIYPQRLKDYIIKAIREAEIQSSWIKPKVEYEDACLRFIDQLLNNNQNNEFLTSFLTLHMKISYLGVNNSLSQTLLKLTCPGIPDFYQGTELWDFSFVDPDNRRSVNYAQRVELLKESLNTPKKVSHNIFKDQNDPKIKFHLISKILKFKKTCPELFSQGTYIPIEIKGKFNNHVLAFARQFNDQWTISIITRFISQLGNNPSWEDTYLVLPDNAPLRWQNVLTEQILDFEQNIPISQLADDLPIVFMKN